MTEIIPRWEWRTFDQEFGRAEAALGQLSPDQVAESTELYVVSATGNDVVKVREELVDVKHLHERDLDGLERWAPVLKAPFPLSWMDLTVVSEALGVAPPTSPAQAAISLSEFLVELVEPHPELVAVEARKTRRRYLLGRCMAELTDVRTDHGSTRTLAVESESAEQVLSVLRDLGLEPRPNVNYVRALRVLARFGVERCAVIDVGTNSVKFHASERGLGGDWRTLVDRAEVTRLGDGLDQSGRLSPEAMDRTIAAIATMAKEAKALRVAAIAAVGTAGLRIATTARDFAHDVEARCGVHLEVISGEDEARLAYLAAIAGLGLTGSGSRVIFDTGGGSSQFTFGDGGQVREQFSVEVGAVRYTEQYGLDGPVSVEVLAAALEAIEQGLACLEDRATPELLVGMGGAVTNLAAVRHALPAYDPDVVQGTVLDASEIDRQIELYRARTSDERREIVGLQAGRADVILAGACIVRTVLRVLGTTSLTVSDHGLRHGLLAERFGWTPGTAPRLGPEVP